MLKPNWSPGRRQLRQFAVAALIGFALLASTAWWGAGAPIPAAILAAAGIGIALVGLPFPRAIRPVYLLVTIVALPLGWLVSGLVVGLIFYGVFTPIGALFRLMGRDPLLLKRPSGSSYWREVRQPGDAGSYYRQG